MRNHLAINPCPLDIGEFTLRKCLGFRERAVVLFSAMTRKVTLWSRLVEVYTTVHNGEGPHNFRLCRASVLAVLSHLPRSLDRFMCLPGPMAEGILPLLHGRSPQCIWATTPVCSARLTSVLPCTDLRIPIAFQRYSSQGRYWETEAHRDYKSEGLWSWVVVFVTQSVFLLTWVEMSFIAHQRWLPLRQYWLPGDLMREMVGSL